MVEKKRANTPSTSSEGEKQSLVARMALRIRDAPGTLSEEGSRGPAANATRLGRKQEKIRPPRCLGELYGRGWGGWNQSYGGCE